MVTPDLPEEFLRRCRSVTSKRPRTVIEHILEYGFITTEELKERYGYNHPPRAARDVREQGIPLETFKVTGRDGRQIAAYRFADPEKLRADGLTGRQAIPKAFKKLLLEHAGARCAIHGDKLAETYLQIDHRVPFEIAGEPATEHPQLADYMLLCGSANRAKSWSCEHCVNWQELRQAEICHSCYWAAPENYTHVAMQDVRRVEIIWRGTEVADYERLKQKAESLQKDRPTYIKDILKSLIDE